MLDSEALSKIRSLELRAKIVVEGFRVGLHRSPYHGFSAEFSEYRQYAPGDDSRHVDWRVFARSDRYFIKKYEDETNLRCQLLVDASRSMAFGSGPMTKAAYAATLAATLAYFLYGQGDAVGVTTFADSVMDYLPPKSTRGHLRRLMLLLEKSPTGAGTDLGEPLRRVAEMEKKRGLFILVSDLLAPVDMLGARLNYLRARGNDVVVFQVLAPEELDFSFDRVAPFVDLESGQEVMLDPGLARGRYREALQRHLDEILEICCARGIGYHLLCTDKPVEEALRRFLGGRDALQAGAMNRRGRL